MTDATTELRHWLIYAEKQSASIAADKRLPEMRDFQPDPVWKEFFRDAIDPARHRSEFDHLRMYLDLADSGAMDVAEALEEAETIRRRFDNTRQYLAEAVARWDQNDQNAQTRRAQMKRTTWQWKKCLADHLRETVGGSKQQQWDSIPDDAEGMDGIRLELDGKSAEVFRRGDTLCCDDGIRIDEIAYASFHRHYLKAGKDKSR